jgi:lipoprotein-anchoring transpeptidase ErfK/SrfK
MLRLRELAFVTSAAMAVMCGAGLWQAMHLSPAAPTVVASKPAIPVKVQPRVALEVAPPVTEIPTPVPQKAALAKKAPVLEADADEGTAPDATPLTEEQLAAQRNELDKQSDGVAARLQDKVPANLMRYFDVVLYVSKAGEGAWAQHMFIFHRASDGSLVYEKNIPVSTGREQREKYFTDTPAGIFELDPARFEPMHHSHTWHGAPMAWAMFLNFTLHNRQVGIALHSAGPHIAELGHRASGGCVRLPPDQASELYHRFQSEDRGMVPVLAFDNASGSTSRLGEMMPNGGQPLMTEGYKVLLVIEDYPGGPALVAVLS